MLFSVLAADTFAQEKEKEKEKNTLIAGTAAIREIVLETGGGFVSTAKESRLGGQAMRGQYITAAKTRASGPAIKRAYLQHKILRNSPESIIENGFFDLEPFYRGTTSDIAMVKIIVVCKNGS